MTTDLWMLVWTVVLASLLPMLAIAGRMQVPGGMAWALGNRDTPLEVAAWAGRAERAHRNLLENLAGFAALVLIAHVTGNANAATALGAKIFFWGRVAHAAVYVAGIPGLRTAVFFVAVFGELLILLQLF
jgi:uncharacterized MAPEG superfamily protein